MRTRLYTAGWLAVGMFAGTAASQTASAPPGGVAAATGSGGVAAGGGTVVNNYLAGPPKTIWNALGINKANMAACKTKFLQGPLGRCINKIPLCLRPAPNAAQVAALGAAYGPPPSPPAVAAAIKMDRAQAKVRVQAVKYLGSVNCADWPEASQSLAAALRYDHDERVRYAAAEVLLQGCCCTPLTIKALTESMTGSVDPKDPKALRETSRRVQMTSAKALELCLAKSCSSFEFIDTLPPPPAEPPPAEPPKPARIRDTPPRSGSTRPADGLAPPPESGVVPPAGAVPPPAAAPPPADVLTPVPGAYAVPPRLEKSPAQIVAEARRALAMHAGLLNGGTLTAGPLVDASTVDRLPSAVNETPVVAEPPAPPMPAAGAASIAPTAEPEFVLPPLPPGYENYRREKDVSPTSGTLPQPTPPAAVQPTDLQAKPAAGAAKPAAASRRVANPASAALRVDVPALSPTPAVGAPGGMPAPILDRFNRDESKYRYNP